MLLQRIEHLEMAQHNQLAPHKESQRDNWRSKNCDRNYCSWRAPPPHHLTACLLEKKCLTEAVVRMGRRRAWRKSGSLKASLLQGTTAVDELIQLHEFLVPDVEGFNIPSKNKEKDLSSRFNRWKKNNNRFRGWMLIICSKYKHYKTQLAAYILPLINTLVQNQVTTTVSTLIDNAIGSLKCHEM